MNILEDPSLYSWISGSIHRLPFAGGKQETCFSETELCVFYILASLVYRDPYEVEMTLVAAEPPQFLGPGKPPFGIGYEVSCNRTLPALYERSRALRKSLNDAP